MDAGMRLGIHAHVCSYILKVKIDIRRLPQSPFTLFIRQGLFLTGKLLVSASVAVWLALESLLCVFLAAQLWAAVMSTWHLCVCAEIQTLVLTLA